MLIQKWLQTGSRKRRRKKKLKLDSEKAKHEKESKASQDGGEVSAEGVSKNDVAPEEDDDDEESESDDELDEETLKPLPTFEVPKHWRNTVTAPKRAPCSVMGERGCLYLLFELKRNLATQDKTRITKSIDNYFHHSKRAEGVTIPF